MPDNWWQHDETVGPAPKASPGAGDWWAQDETVQARPAGPPAKGPNQVLRNQPAETTGQMVKGLLKRQVMRSATGGAFDTWEDASDWFFGTKERRELQAEGIGGFQPTPSKMAQSVVFEAGPMVGEALPMMAGMGGSAPAAARWAASHPRVVNAALGAAPGVLEGNPKAAAYGAAAGVILGGRKAKAAEETATALAELRAATAEAKAAASAARGPAPAVPAEAPPMAPEPAPVPARVAPAADPGKAAAAAHNRTMAFAKEAAQSNPKIGQKIWMELDEAGAPVRLLTPDQAGAAARRGLPTTWVKNLWASSAR